MFLTLVVSGKNVPYIGDQWEEWARSTKEIRRLNSIFLNLHGVYLCARSSKREAPEIRAFPSYLKILRRRILVRKLR